MSNRKQKIISKNVTLAPQMVVRLANGDWRCVESVDTHTVIYLIPREAEWDIKRHSMTCTQFLKDIDNPFGGVVILGAELMRAQWKPSRYHFNRP